MMTHSLVTIALYAAMALGLFSALGAVTLRPLFPAALSLSATLLAWAAALFLMGFHFPALAQALSGILLGVLFLSEARSADSLPEEKNKPDMAALAGTAIFFAILLPSLLKTSWPAPGSALPAPLPHVLIFTAAFFSTGLYGIFTRRGGVSALMALELLLNAAALNLAVFSKTTALVSETGQIFAASALALAAAAAAIGLRLIRLPARKSFGGGAERAKT